MRYSCLKKESLPALMLFPARHFNFGVQVKKQGWARFSMINCIRMPLCQDYKRCVIDDYGTFKYILIKLQEKESQSVVLVRGSRNQDYHNDILSEFIGKR